MKIAIVTITDGQNYGNRLQNYAMQQLLKKTGAEVLTLQRKSSRDIKGLAKISAEIKYRIKRILGKPSDKWRRVRIKRFKEFNEKFVVFSDEILQKNQASNRLKEKYDYFVCGSDQVWNAHFDIIKEDIKNYLAFFADSEQRIAYAASFGANDIASGYEAFFSEYLPEFKAISVRENSGVDIIRKICKDCEVEVVLDPTMMLEPEEWRKISKKPQNIQTEKFIVTYFLGDCEGNVAKYINSVERKMQCKAHNLSIEFKLDIEISNPEDYIVTPDEFVWMIEHAECVLTDSYHATVFAILFHKPFCVFERCASENGNNMGGRVDTLLGIFGLSQFKGNLENMNIYPEIYDGKEVDIILQKERDKSHAFLYRALDL